MREMYENIDMNESGKYKRIIDHAKGNEFTVTNWKNEPRRMLREVKVKNKKNIKNICLLFSHFIERAPTKTSDRCFQSLWKGGYI